MEEIIMKMMMMTIMILTLATVGAIVAYYRYQIVVSFLKLTSSRKFEKECLKLSDGYYMLNPIVLRTLCLKVPFSGIKLKEGSGSIRTLEPLVKLGSLTDANKYIGKYYAYSGIVVFITGDGATYIGHLFFQEILENHGFARMKPEDSDSDLNMNLMYVSASCFADKTVNNSWHNSLRATRIWA